jgi:hypothetical protein
MAWVQYNKFIKALQGKTDDEIEALVHKHFKINNCLTASSCFHASVKIMFATKTTYDNGVAALKALYPIYNYFFPTRTTLRRYLSQIRMIIKKTGNEKLYGESQLDRTFNMPKEERDKVSGDYTADITKKNLDKVELDARLIESKILELSLSKNVYDKILLILICIGSRPLGVFHTNTYKETADGQVEVGSLTKKREHDKDTTVVRPVLFITAKTLVQKWDQVRSHFKNKIVVDKDNLLAKDKNATLNRRALKHFPWLKDYKQKSSMFRKVWADLSYRQFADTSKVNFNSWIQQKLSHTNLITSFSYSWISFVDTKKLKDGEELNQKFRALEIKLDMVMNERLTPAEKKKEKVKVTGEDRDVALEEIYVKNPKITVRAMQAAAHMSTRTVSAFLRDKRKKQPQQ